MPDTRADILPQPTRLSDYRPSDFFVETVDLDELGIAQPNPDEGGDATPASCF